MRILVVNDDGIKAPGIKRLVQMAAGLGEVWVVAPAAQCSAMSHRITVRGDLEVKPYDFPATGVTAYSVGGTPADCVKVALGCLMTEKPDIVFSGINAGYNVGRDILYSGTIGAAMEALCWGVPAIAFSVAEEDECEVLNTYLEPVAKELISKTLPQNEIWNVNFPGCTLEEYKGILWDRIPDQNAYSVWGTPADCVKVALGCLMTEKPDIVFSGINAGYNVGRDILYSGTIGAAMEALCWGVPAIAFSVAEEDECEVLNTYLEPVAKELISKTLPQNEIWNVNFPGCTLEEYKGILWDRIPDQNQYYRDNYKRTDRPDGSCIFSAAGLPETEAADGTDAGAVLSNYISIGTIKNMII